MAAIVEPVPTAADVRAEILSIHCFTSKGRVLVAQMIGQPIAEFAVVLPIERGCICLAGNRGRRAQSACYCVTDAFGGHASDVPPARRDLRGALTPSIQRIHFAPEAAKWYGKAVDAGDQVGKHRPRDVIADARLVFFGVGTKPVRARAAEAALIGQRADAMALAAAGRALDGDLDPPGDIHGSPALRRHLARVLLARVVRRLAEGGS
jgi:hypothetical protein